MNFILLSVLAISTVYAAPLTNCSSNDLCKGKASGTYPYSKEPNHFYTCIGEVNLGCQHCSASYLVYSKECDACLSRADALNKICPVATTPQSVNNCAPKGFCNGKMNKTFQNPSNSNQFFSCISGAPTLCQNCPVGLVYSEICEQCLTKDDGNCFITSNPSTVQPKTCWPIEFCIGKGDGNYQKNSSKRENEYYQCANGACFVKTCPPSLVYNPAGYCDYA